MCDVVLFVTRNSTPTRGSSFQQIPLISCPSCLRAYYFSLQCARSTMLSIITTETVVLLLHKLCCTEDTTTRQRARKHIFRGRIYGSDASEATTRTGGCRPSPKDTTVLVSFCHTTKQRDRAIHAGKIKRSESKVLNKGVQTGITE
jgi:hypothetical protein